MHGEAAGLQSAATMGTRGEETCLGASRSSSSGGVRAWLASRPHPSSCSPHGWAGKVTTQHIQRPDLMAASLEPRTPLMPLDTCYVNDGPASPESGGRPPAGLALLPHPTLGQREEPGRASLVCPLGPRSRMEAAAATRPWGRPGWGWGGEDSRLCRSSAT